MENPKQYQLIGVLKDMNKFILIAFLAMGILTGATYSQDVVEELTVLGGVTYRDGSRQTSAYPVVYANVSTSLVFRKNWSPAGLYSSNDFVGYGGNLFYVYTNIPQVGAPPSLDENGVGINNAFWEVMLEKGASGATTTQHLMRTVSSSSNFVAWISNSVDNSISYWGQCLTNGTGGGITQQVFRYV